MTIMETSLEECNVNNIQDEIRDACSSLEERGFDCMVVITSKDRHIELGSSKARNFIEDFPDYFKDFMHYCQVKREKQLGIDDDYKSQSPSSVVIVNHLRKVTKSLKQENRNTTNEVFDSSEASTQEKDTTSLETNTSKLKNCISDGDCDDAGGIDSEEEEEEQTMDRDKEYSTKKIKGSNMAAKRSSKRKYERHKAQLKMTVSSQNGRVTERYYCDRCDKNYSSKPALIIHKRKHTGEAPYTCGTCGKSFRSRNFLRSHSTVHSTELKFNCDLCGQAFARKYSLRRHHVNIHSDVRHHVCDTCGCSFKNKNDLTYHKMRHTGERNHGCAICNKQFVLKHELDAHMNVHTRLKKFECGICYQKFTRKHQIQIHQKRYHPGEEIDLHVSVFTK